MKRMAKLDRVLTLVHALNETADGLTLDDMAGLLGVTRRTAERLRVVVAEHFDLEEWTEDRRKRFRIRDSLRRVYTRPSAAEVAALEAEAQAARRRNAAQAPLLENLLAKVKGTLDDREKRRLDPDLEALARLQRAHIPAGPAVSTAPETVAVVQGAIMAGQCLEFAYLADGAKEPKWRRVIPFGLIHGPTTYLIGKMPGREAPPVPWRLDRMREPRASNEPGCPPDEWNLDEWMAASFGLWREDGHDIVLRVRENAVARARQWRFHAEQELEDDGKELLVRFHSGGLREIAEHLFTWGGDVAIEAPEALRVTMRKRLAAAERSVRPDLTQAPAKVAL